MQENYVVNIRKFLKSMSIILVLVFLIGVSVGMIIGYTLPTNAEKKPILETTKPTPTQTFEWKETEEPTQTPTATLAPTVEPTEEPMQSLGEFLLTAYCGCEVCCDRWAKDRPKDEHGNDIVIGAIGEVLTEGYSIAVDPKIIPYGTEVVINGNTYKAQDCGGGIKNKRIDVYFVDHQDAREFGKQYAEVFLKGDGENV